MYGFVENNGINAWDLLGMSSMCPGWRELAESMLDGYKKDLEREERLKDGLRGPRKKKDSKSKRRRDDRPHSNPPLNPRLEYELLVDRMRQLYPQGDPYKLAAREMNRLSGFRQGTFDGSPEAQQAAQRASDAMKGYDDAMQFTTQMAAMGAVPMGAAGRGLAGLASKGVERAYGALQTMGKVADTGKAFYEGATGNSPYPGSISKSDIGFHATGTGANGGITKAAQTAGYALNRLFQ